jgi:hypothetical protein
MPLADLTQDAVEQAIAEFDRLGSGGPFFGDQVVGADFEPVVVEITGTSTFLCASV